MFGGSQHLIYNTCSVVRRALAHGAWLLVMAVPVAHGISVEVKNSEGEPLEGAVVAVYQHSEAKPPSPDDLPKTAIIDQRERQFVPEVLAVEVGTLVEFPNSDDIRHHVYSFSPAKKFELRLYHGTTAEPVLFNQAGKVVLGCNIHDSMLGYIYVLETNRFAVTNEYGKVSIEVPAEAFELEVQHPLVANRYLQVIDTNRADNISVTLDNPGQDPRQAEPKTELEALFQSL